MNTLPTEVKARIIQFSLKSSPSKSHRQQTLCSLALVNRSLSALAQPLLFRSAQLSTNVELRSFWKVMEIQAFKVNELCISGSKNPGSSTIAAEEDGLKMRLLVLQSCRNLKRLTLKDLPRTSLLLLSRAGLSSLTDLTLIGPTKVSPQFQYRISLAEKAAIKDLCPNVSGRLQLSPLKFKLKSFKLEGAVPPIVIKHVVRTISKIEQLDIGADASDDSMQNILSVALPIVRRLLFRLRLTVRDDWFLPLLNSAGRLQTFDYHVHEDEMGMIADVLLSMPPTLQTFVLRDKIEVANEGEMVKSDKKPPHKSLDMILYKALWIVIFILADEKLDLPRLKHVYVPAKELGKMMAETDEALLIRRRRFFDKGIVLKSVHK